MVFIDFRFGSAIDTLGHESTLNSLTVSTLGISMDDRDEHPYNVISSADFRLDNVKEVTGQLPTL